MTNFFDHRIEGADGHADILAAQRGNVVLAVNVASECGFTPQYEGLEALYRDARDSGFSVIGFPCNQFGAQEPGDEKDILEFCSTRYSVTFPLTKKIDVNGDAAHPVYAWLTDPANGHPGAIQWNFEKFLIGRDGFLVGRYPSATRPGDAVLMQEIAGALER